MGCSSFLYCFLILVIVHLQDPSRALRWSQVKRKHPLSDHAMHKDGDDYDPRLGIGVGVGACSNPINPSSQYKHALMDGGGKLALLVAASTSVALGTRPTPAVARGYKASISIFAPSSPLVTTPLLAQSALLNSLPIRSELIGQIQAYLESFDLLIEPTVLTKKQIKVPESSLWTTLAGNAQRAAGVFLYNKNEYLVPPIESLSQSLPSRVSTSTSIGSLSEKYLGELQIELLKLVNASRKADPIESINNVRKAMTSLHNVGSLLTWARNATMYEGATDKDLQVYVEEGVPILQGRPVAVVNLYRPSTQEDIGKVKLCIDGYNHPITGGNFVDLVNRGYYSSLSVENRVYENENGALDMLVFGCTPQGQSGYKDPATNKVRTVPVEVLREEIVGTTDGGVKSRRFSAVGAARNSAVFTQANTVYNFATQGAIGMYHATGDINGASAPFFWTNWPSSLTTRQRSKLQVLDKMNRRFSIFAFILEGEDQVMRRLQPGDVVNSIALQEGAWRLCTKGT